MNVGEFRNAKQQIQVQGFVLSLNIEEIQHEQVLRNPGISIRHTLKYQSKLCYRKSCID